jgi:peptidoglycan/LPS O-acetylase OafA/YrhL
MLAIRSAFRVFISRPLGELFRPPAGQIAALDFLRTCAVLLVLVFHFSNAAYLPAAGGTTNWFSEIFFVRYGRIGVDLFFVLSGYFIGKQLWRELDRRGRIDLGRFVIRRGLRIWPLYYAVFAFAVLRGCALAPEQWWAGLLFLTNYFPTLNVVPGSWTLSIEEQFYVATPLLLVVGGRSGCRSVGTGRCSWPSWSPCRSSDWRFTGG